MTKLNILINGAGIAGNAAAFWLSKLGHDVTVVERFPSLRATGLQVDLRGHGIQVLRLMGLEQGFREKMAPEQGMQVVDKTGRRRAFFPANKPGQGLQNFTSEFEIMRGDLCRLMYDATKHRARYLFNTSVKTLNDEGDSVSVTYTNGACEKFDLVVGADGQGSAIRKMMFDPATVDACYHEMKNVYMAYFVIPRPIATGEEYIATTYMAPGRRGIMTRRHSPAEIQVYLGCTTSDSLVGRRGEEDLGALKAAWANVFKGAGWQADDIIRALMESESDFYSECPALVKLESWSNGRVTLVGDAGYCPTATTGMGTTCALVGAYILAGEVGKHVGPAVGNDKRARNGEADCIAAALGAYQGQFQPFVDHVQKGVSVSGETGFVDRLTSTGFGIAILNNVMALASLFRVNIGQWFLKEDVKGWELPVYGDM
jgi:2-polyprenyl-6-methoxyphenol hydroxylase-like FAD-dependent oxidoreductase